MSPVVLRGVVIIQSKMKLINSLVSIALLSASAEAKKPAFAPKQYTHDVLSIRGGAGPLDPDMIGKSDHHFRYRG